MNIFTLLISKLFSLASFTFFHRYTNRRHVYIQIRFGICRNILLLLFISEYMLYLKSLHVFCLHSIPCTEAVFNITESICIPNKYQAYKFMPWNGEVTIWNFSLNGRSAVWEFSQMGISDLKEMVKEWWGKKKKQNHLHCIGFFLLFCSAHFSENIQELCWKPQ